MEGECDWCSEEQGSFLAVGMRGFMAEAEFEL